MFDIPEPRSQTSEPLPQFPLLGGIILLSCKSTRDPINLPISPRLSYATFQFPIWGFVFRMESESPLDYAVFQLSPRRSRCELFVSYDGTTEKIASGLFKPFLNHLKAAKEQVAPSVKSITLEVENRGSSDTWFTKGNLERFVQFVSTPEVLELVNSFDAEVSQLEAARKIYSQGPDEGSVGDGGVTTASDATKKELLRAIDIRLTAVRQDLCTACARASAAGFNPINISELQHFANEFGAHRLSESCFNYMSLYQRRPELFPAKKTGVNDNQAVPSSSAFDSSLSEFKSATMQSVDKPSPTLSSYSNSSRESSIEKEDSKDRSDMDKEKKDNTSITKVESEPPSTRPCPPARQLSVQERISLFENKQQEKSTSGSGSKPVIGKSAELRRLSSDVSSASQMVSEKAVLRRWSGAGDLSIHSGEEKKDADSCTQVPTLNPIKIRTTSIISDDMDRVGLFASMPENKEIDSSQISNVRLENETDPRKKGLKRNHATENVGAQLTVFSGVSEEVCSQSNSTSFSEKFGSDGWKDQSNILTQSKVSSDRTKDFGLNNHRISPAMPGNFEQFDSEALSSCKEEATTSFVAQKAQLVAPPSTLSYDILDCNTYEDTADPEDMGLKKKNVPKSRLKTFQKPAIGRGSTSGSSVVSSVPVVSQNKEGELDQMIATPKWRSSGDIEEARKDYVSAEKQPDRSSIESKGSGSNKMKFQKHSSASNHVRKARVKRDDSGSGSRMPGGAGKTISDNQETFSSISSTSVEQGQRMKQSRGNQELNDELKLKANELEKLFAEHKSSVTRGSKSVKTEERESILASKHSSLDISSPQAASVKMVPESSRPSYKKKSTASPLTQPLENHDFGDTPKGDVYSLGYSDQSRGKFYEKYTQKRDAKLKEEWSSNRAEKEAKLKSLQDSLERSRSEMKSKLAGLNDIQDSNHRAEKLRSFTSRSGVRQLQPIHSFVSDEDEDQAELGQASTPVLAGVSAPRFVKASASGAGRQKLQQENPFTQSVPNFSDFRKDNSKASTAASKGAAHSLNRNYSRSKSSDKDVLSFEEKSRTAQHSRKSQENPLESKDVESAVDEDYDNTDNGRARGSQESVKTADLGCENGDVHGVPSQFIPSSMSEMPATLPSPFRTMLTVLGSPGESPGSWHPHMHNPYSFQHETSDFDASVDSPIGSPAYWNTNDSDAAIMRKKWGATQKRVVSDSSHQPRKDVSKGLKRFLKFGRKNRGADSLNDWVSATTSEGDDDTEEGKDPAGNKSMDDLRKSRMGFLHYHNEDGFSETDSFGDQVHGFPSSSPTPMNFKLREDHLSGSTMKGVTNKRADTSRFLTFALSKRMMPSWN
ncbi:hypothetical protein V2J09_003057 [Rumex salicifolius]